jgi:hypothetical protein
LSLGSSTEIYDVFSSLSVTAPQKSTIWPTLHLNFTYTLYITNTITNTITNSTTLYSNYHHNLIRTLVLATITSRLTDLRLT